ncbi:unnamed protein product [Chondrus crispus]|uniref:Uncharacterized protein n=1 Tax=Chondrus crispus TaxID=2769 RepID=R7QRT8_CHOCR|nr:unnamed protein product [Chondrus crispus]CDF40070.1 unnamed protein product [Chondrus crispus]|eukprot:XP_005710364.1 unnamed protein product [Chondrus crispus]
MISQVNFNGSQSREVRAAGLVSLSCVRSGSPWCGVTGKAACERSCSLPHIRGRKGFPSRGACSCSVVARASEELGFYRASRGRTAAETHNI